MTRDELIEQVARAIAVAWDEEGRVIDAARAAIDVVLEEAAKVVEFSPNSHTAGEMCLMRDKAAAIRAMKDGA